MICFFVSKQYYKRILIRNLLKSPLLGGRTLESSVPLGILILIIFIIFTPNVFAASVEDPSLIVEEYVTGILSPTSIDFIGDELLYMTACHVRLE